MFKVKVKDLRVGTRFFINEYGYERILTGYSSKEKCYTFACTITNIFGYIKPDKYVLVSDRYKDTQMKLSI